MKRWIATIASLLMLCSATVIAADSVLLVETERAKLEKEFKEVLVSGNRGKYVDFYDSLDPKEKKRIAKVYSLIKAKGLDAKKTVSATAAIIESALGVKNAKIIVAEWTKNRRDANVETYSVAQKIKSVGKLVPEILELYDVAELEEIDQLQKEIGEAIVAQSEQRAAQSEQRAAQSEQRAAQNRKEIERLDAVIKRLEILMEKN